MSNSLSDMPHEFIYWLTCNCCGWSNHIGVFLSFQEAFLSTFFKIIETGFIETSNLEAVAPVPPL